MRCLWITLADPEPQLSGQFVYSGGLIRSFAGAGADISVLGLSRPESRRPSGSREDGVTWWLGGTHRLPPSASLMSSLPNIANRCRTPLMQQLLAARLDENRWDLIVFDGLSAVWALGPVLRKYPDPRRRPKIVHVSHNHEESSRADLSKAEPNFLKRQALRWDGLKIARTERALLSAADLVTAITPEDGDLYRRQWPNKPIEIVMPGYRGRTLSARRITGEVPRRAVIVGTFDWIAKRINIEEFVGAADRMFARNGVELQVIGKGDEGFLRAIRSRVKATSFTGPVERIDEYLDGARIALVPERVGGGFKLKVLDYVFNRMPILALRGAAAGVPLQKDKSILLFSGQEELAQGVIGAIDDLDCLNRLQESAYFACRDQFDWGARGRQLATAVEAL